MRLFQSLEILTSANFLARTSPKDFGAKTKRSNCEMLSSFSVLKKLKYNFERLKRLFKKRRVGSRLCWGVGLINWVVQFKYNVLGQIRKKFQKFNYLPVDKVPYPPKSTLVRDRFMALHMM